MAGQGLRPPTEEDGAFRRLVRQLRDPDEEFVAQLYMLSHVVPIGLIGSMAILALVGFVPAYFLGNAFQSTLLARLLDLLMMAMAALMVGSLVVLKGLWIYARIKLARNGRTGWP